ncbi:hypothetical protein HZS_5631 [Henneguya salminicola]|uniref:Nucleoside-diphosphatase mig-23 (Trinotate prediction) n=1 Tax=Henneguya salminicola TaxID=69463 RepID=A0A6G3ME79_HENSL|nr:hypothetical protein HZS_5631 [Henneguya salminicola]
MRKVRFVTSFCSFLSFPCIKCSLKFMRRNWLYYLLFILIIIICFYYRTKRKLVDHSSFNSRNYAVMIDCGSSGSRLRMYYWNGDSKSVGLPSIKIVRDKNNEEIVNNINKPLSSFADNPKSSIDYITELVRKSYEYIPFEKHSSTALYVLATGGMRLLPIDKSESLISALRQSLSSNIKYNLIMVEIISGRMEGVFMWIGLNYILKKFKVCGQDTHGMIETGGASMQIAFEVESLNPGSSHFSYICPENSQLISHNIYSITFLGLGVNSAYKYYLKNHVLPPTINPGDFDNDLDPCLALNCVFSDGGITKKGTGGPDECFTHINYTFNRYLRREKDAATMDQFTTIYKTAWRRFNLTFYGLSEFWYGFNDFLHYQGPLIKSHYWSINKEFCSQDCNVLMKNMQNGFYKTNEHRHLTFSSVFYFSLQCFKVSYLQYIMDKFLPLESNNPVINAKSLNGQLIEWTQGALVYYLSQKPK